MAKVSVISVIIPAFNEAEQIGSSIKKIKSALEKSLAPNSWELIVCDNNSTDDTAKIASSLGTEVVHEAQNQISRARNTGARAAQGDWLLFIDADSYPPPELLQETLSVIQSGKFVGCGSTVQVLDGLLWNKLRIERLNPFMRWGNWCGGAYLLCEKTAFQAIEGFSENLYALEEIDFLIRLKRYGKKQQKKFTVLHNYPVVSSGRKGELNIGSIFRLVSSNLLAPIFLLLHYLLPSSWKIKASPSLLSFWYKRN